VLHLSIRYGLVGALVAVTGVALAAELPYRPGTYDVDPCRATTNRACSEDDNGTLRMTVRRGKFKVWRISLTETCDNGARSFRGPFTFQAGTQAKLAGKVTSEGRFKGRYTSEAGEVKVRGRIRGSRLRLVATESGTFTREDEPPYECRGSITFRARR
jgi:hypothetical protein